MNYQGTPHFKQSTITRSRSLRRRTEEEYRFPSVSIFMGFEPKMGNKKKINKTLAGATANVTSELKNKYPGEMSVLVLQKLKECIKNLDYSTHKKSLAIFVSPIFTKTFYFDMPVKERVSVKESFHIRDLVHNKKELKEFHILFLGEKESRIFLSNDNSLVRIIPPNIPTEKTIKEDAKRPGANDQAWPVTGSINEEFFHQIDHTLGSIIQSAKLPVFVMGNRKMMEVFKDISQNQEIVVGYVVVEKEGVSLEYLTNLLDTNLDDWQKIRQKFLSTRLIEAVNRNEFACGMEKVWQKVFSTGGGRLLLDKDYLYELDQWDVQAVKYDLPGSYNRFSCIKNPVDKMIATVLENGGDVEFVTGDFLKKYHQIAFLKDY